MRITVSGFNGMTGSELITGVYLYFSKTPFTLSNLPKPYFNNVSPSSGYTVNFPEVDVPFWTMWGYRGADGQMAYGPLMAQADYSDAMKSLFGSNMVVPSGDSINGQLPSTLSSSYKVTPSAIDLAIGKDSMWDRGTEVPRFFMVNANWVGASTAPNKTAGNALTMYTNGYMDKSGDMTDQYSVDLIASLGGPVAQGAYLAYDIVKWNARVPTLGEFVTYLGSIYSSGITSTAPPITTWQFPVNTWFLTSTESATRGSFVAINAKGETKDVLPTDTVAIYLLFTGELT